jgi:hypothetical protein
MNAEYVRALLGGALIGGAAGALLLLNGRMAGVTGILSGVLAPRPGETAWRTLFLCGLLAGGFVLRVIAPERLPFDTATPIALALVAGLLVGFGAKLGGGCTSGHGICGIGRFSVRSMIAVATFTLTGALTIVVMRALGAAPR